MRRDKIRRIILMFLCVAVAVGIIFILLSTGESGLETDAAREEILKNHVEFTGAGNAVSAIYLNYRLWDTLFEALVLLVSAGAVITFSRSGEDEG
jgi:multisubunit Na+/H+ antiporter MnhB subunit